MRKMVAWFLSRALRVVGEERAVMCRGRIVRSSISLRAFFGRSFLRSLVLPVVSLFLMLCLCLVSSGCGAQSAAFIVAGSTSVQPYVEMLAEEYSHIYPDVLIDVQGGGSSAGITAVESDTAELGMSSRHLKESEQHLWSIDITKDGLAIIIHPDNPVFDLTLEQVRSIYAAEVTNWSVFGGPNAKIHIITREEGSGTRSAFEELVMHESRITPRAMVQDSNGAVRQLVVGDPHSIGFISLGLVDVGEKSVKPLHIEGVEPTRDNVINGSYTLFRSFLFVAKSEPDEDVMHFIEYICSPEGQRLLADEGLIPE